MDSDPTTPTTGHAEVEGRLHEIARRVARSAPSVRRLVRNTCRTTDHTAIFDIHPDCITTTRHRTDRSDRAVDRINALQTHAVGIRDLRGAM